MHHHILSCVSTWVEYCHKSVIYNICLLFMIASLNHALDAFLKETNTLVPLAFINPRTPKGRPLTFLFTPSANHFQPDFLPNLVFLTYWASEVVRDEEWCFHPIECFK